jgi:hypothetical protein
MLPISRYGRYGLLGPDDPNNSQPFMSAPCLLQEQGGLAPVQQSTIPTSSAFLVGPVDNTPPPPSPSVVIHWDSGFQTPSQCQSPTPSTVTEVSPKELKALRALIPSPGQDAYRVSDAELQEILDSIPNLSQEECYGRLAIVSDVDDGGFALNVDKRVERICRAITKQVQRSDARIEVDMMHTWNECTE